MRGRLGCCEHRARLTWSRAILRCRAGSFSPKEILTNPSADVSPDDERLYTSSLQDPKRGETGVLGGEADVLGGASEGLQAAL